MDNPSKNEELRKTDIDDSLRCNSSELNFDTIEVANEHSTSHHHVKENGSSSSMYTCGICSQHFANIALLIKHHDVQHGAIDMDVMSDDSNKGNTTTAESPINATSPLNSHEESDQPVNKKRRIVRLDSNNHETYEPQAKRATIPDQIRKEEIEIDMSRVSFIRLKNNETSETNQAIMERQDELFEYLEKIDEKLDSIMKHFNVPYSNTVKLKSFASVSRPTRKLAPSSVVENGGESSSRVNLVFMGEERSQHETGEITQYVISDELVEQMYIRSRNRGNFAKHLTYAAFPLEERLGRNCYGRRCSAIGVRKLALDPAKLDAVREAVFRKYPCLDGDEEEQVWRKECVIAIDTALRSEMRRGVKGEHPDVKYVPGTEPGTPH